MATFTFDGSSSQTVAFNATVDRVIFNLDAADLASVSQDEDNNTVTFVAVSGAILTLTGTNFAAIRANVDSLQPGLDSDITFGIGGDGGNNLFGNVLVGLGGGDFLDARTTDDDGALVFGNEGSDTLLASGASVRLYGGQGGDDIEIQNNDDDSASLVVGGLGQDDIDINTFAGNNYTGSITVFGGNEAGDPTDAADDITLALGQSATAVVYGNGGDDDIDVTSGVNFDGNVSVYGGQGLDDINVQLGGGAALLVGGADADTLTVTLADDASATVIGGIGAGDASNDVDTIVVNGANGSTAEVYGNGGNDVITLFGQVEASVYGGQGNDAITGAVDGGSEIYGGLGFDTINLTVAGNSSAIEVYGGNGDADAADGADIINVTLTSTAGVAPAPGSDQTAVIYGNGGNDVITLAGEGAATVFGGAGDDIIVAGADGQYTFTGGLGSDEFDLSGFDFNPVSGLGDEPGTVGRNENVADTEAEVPFITDMAFGTDTIDLPVAIAATSDQTSATFAQATLSAAAEAAFDAAFATTATGVNAAVLFNYQGDSYVAFGTNDNPEVVGGTEVDGYFKVTGYTGSFGVSSFEA